MGARSDEEADLLQIFRLFPHGEFAILPGTDHMAFVERVECQVSMIEEFLNNAMPGKSPAAQER